jgi:hypothetical protein
MNGVLPDPIDEFKQESIHGFPDLVATSVNKDRRSASRFFVKTRKLVDLCGPAVGRNDSHPFGQFRKAGRPLCSPITLVGNYG